MSQWDASVHNSRVPEEEWQATRELTQVATQILANREDYLAPERKDIGRRIGDQQHEMFVVCDPSQAMLQQFQQQTPDFIAIHDIASESSPRILAGLAAATQRKVQQLVIRRQGHGVALATLDFAELAGAGGSTLRVYSTRADADTLQRQALAQVLLSHARLGVIMVGELPAHALDTALKPVRDGIARGPWPNRSLLLVPMGAPGAIAQAAAVLGGRTGVQVRCTAQALKPSDAWSFISEAWNHLRESGTLPDTMRQTQPPLADISRPAPASPLQRPQVAPLPMEPMPPTRRSAAPEPDAQNPWQAYVRQCIEITGMISCCVFDLATQRTLAHAGARPGPATLATQGAALHQSLIEAAKGLGLPAGPPDVAVTYSAHHVLLRGIAGHPGLALHAVLDSHAANLTLARMKLQRLDPQPVAS
ncbi:MAG: hypothetical protein U1E89_20675 [Burkholderiaceae bacterium]